MFIPVFGIRVYSVKKSYYLPIIIVDTRNIKLNIFLNTFLGGGFNKKINRQYFGTQSQVQNG